MINYYRKLEIETGIQMGYFYGLPLIIRIISILP